MTEPVYTIFCCDCQAQLMNTTCEIVATSPMQCSRCYDKRIAEIERGRPEAGKIYRLTSGPDETSIAQGNTWADSEVK